eukprot:1138726-Pelagomonas_calceolata.AAC.3
MVTLIPAWAPPACKPACNQSELKCIHALACTTHTCTRARTHTHTHTHARTHTHTRVLCTGGCQGPPWHHLPGPSGNWQNLLGTSDRWGGGGYILQVGYTHIFPRVPAHPAAAVLNPAGGGQAEVN